MDTNAMMRTCLGNGVISKTSPPFLLHLDFPHTVYKFLKYNGGLWPIE